jgi:predicted  nucleic acid-binding Zn-ribbon protein
MEVLRSRTEEVSASNTQDSQTKLLRQIETLQTQYSLASDNWQGIESSLNARVTALERERDDLAKRESDGRKRTREVNGKARRLEDELEASKDQNSTLEAQVSELKAALTSMESRLNLAEKDASDAKSKISGFDAVLRSRIDEEKVKWRAEMQTYEPPYDPSPSMFRVNPSLSINQRKASSPDLTGSRRSHLSGRVQGLDLSSLLPGEHSRNSSRWSNAQAHPGAPLRTPTDPTFIARHDLSPPLHNGTPPPIESTAPSIHTINPDDDDGIEVGDAASHSSPQRTVAELLSASTSGAGPSVQLVERLSATVRRLETERGATREELARLQAQRDGARDEVVGAMREVDALRGENSALAGLREEVARLRERHDAALEMLGEKSEECDELKNDIVDLKKIYRELVESTMQ